MAKSNPRRAIIREWTSLACEKRQSTQQASAFAAAATSAARRHPGMAASAHRTALKIRQTGEWRELESRRTDAFRPTRSLKSAEMIVRLPIPMTVSVRFAGIGLQRKPSVCCSVYPPSLAQASPLSGENSRLVPRHWDEAVASTAFPLFNQHQPSCSRMRQDATL